MKTINVLNESNIKILDKYKEILNPDYIFIPIKDESKIVVKENSKVLKGTLVYDDGNKIYSSISGLVLKVLALNNYKYLAIKNDFKETTVNKRARNLEELTKDIFLSYMSNDSVKKILIKDVNILYINAIDDDPNIYNKYMYLKNSIDDIGDVIKTIKNIFNIKDIRLVIKNSYNELLRNFKVDIKYVRVPDIYPIGNDTILKKNLINDDNDYLIDLNDIIDIIYEVKKNKLRLEEYITINGNYVKNPAVILVKKYSYLNNILTRFEFIDNDYDIILNNSFCGEIVDPKNVIITDDIKGAIINKKCIYKPSKCSKCGLCVEVCPMKINPLEKSKKCIECGLCNYACPSKIDIVNEVQK